MQDLPEPSPLEVLVRLSTSGICGTDFALASGKLGPARRILGHEGVGRVVKLGLHVPESLVKVGQRVGVTWVRDICGVCVYCLTDGGETRCIEQLNSGRKIDGTFAEYALVPQRYIVELPEGPSDEILSPILCGGVTIYKALKICEAVPGQWIVISGAGGGVGSLGIQYAKAMGFRTIGIDAGVEKKRMCLQLGAEAFLDIKEEKDVTKAVHRITGQGAAAVLVVAGLGSAYQDALTMLAPFGTLVCVGIPPPTQTVQFHPLTFIDKGIKVIGSAVGTRRDIQESIEFVSRGLVTPVVQLTTLEGLSDVATQVENGQVNPSSQSWNLVMRGF